jgi:hypothetical protein
MRTNNSITGYVGFIVVIFIILTSCGKDPVIVIQELRGVAQKGPYNVGANVSIYELNGSLIQTGNNYSTQIQDNAGSFSIKGMEFVSQYVEIKVDGFYFNEVTGEKSSAPLSLFTLSDIKAKNIINTNVITSLEKERVKYLMTTGKTFLDSKITAKSEILKIFEINDSLSTESELLDITGTGEENAILLAVSIILQGYGSVADLSELLANISYDIRDDGKLDDMQLGSILINNAKYLNLGDIRKNIEKRYNEMNRTTGIPDFEKYINQFLENSLFELTNVIRYPTMYKNYYNILSDSVVPVNYGRYSMAAFIPRGTSLKVIFGPVTGYSFAATMEWNPTSDWELYNNAFPKEIIISAQGNSSVAGKFVFAIEGSSSFWFDFYEYESETPTKSRIISW